jgi:Histidine phosphatase superfamily (branch 1)
MLQWPLGPSLMRCSRERPGAPVAPARRYDCRMEPPGITRHRRPFLAPLWVGLAAALVIGGIAWAFYRTGTTTVVFLVRPVEKDPGTIDDPPVSPEGEERAQRLAHMFGASGAGGIDAIYESNDRRAQQTAAPLVERLHRAPVVFSAADARATAGRALREHNGGTVLMIASGRALPDMIGELTGSELARPAADDPDLMYVISIPTFGRAHLVRFRF